MIEVKGLNKQFAANVVYNDYNKVFSSQKVCIDAPNGQGKTTLLMMLTELETRQSGQILFSKKH